tara:strand:- start:15450 stop:16874 length:1425 start_codon:yes stop_codon:yes gene_type:complete
MKGIISYSTYIPWLRLTPDTEGWENPFERAVANFDEDPITMAVSAGRTCLKHQDSKDIKALLFCSTSAPYAEKQNAALIATALGLNADALTLDLGGSLRSGTLGILTALNMLEAYPHGSILVIAAETRLAMPRSTLNDSIGDGAAAILLGRGKVIATIEHHQSTSSVIYDQWRESNSRYTVQWEDRFVADNGIETMVVNSVKTLLADSRLETTDIKRFAFNSSNPRQSNKIKNSLGATNNQIDTTIIDKIGNTGSAMALMELCFSLEQATAKHEWICLSSYGDGVDTLLVLTQEDYRIPNQIIPNICQLITSKNTIPSYEKYAHLKDLWPIAESVRRPEAQPPSVPAIYREQEKNILLRAGQCNECNYVQYPMQKICVNCQRQTSYTIIDLSNTRANLYTYSMDYLAGSLDSPLVICTINFESGGRMLGVMTDRALDEIYVGMPLEMSFRKVTEHQGVKSYFWKAIPMRIKRGE